MKLPLWLIVVVNYFPRIYKKFTAAYIIGKWDFWKNMNSQYSLFYTKYQLDSFIKIPLWLVTESWTSIFSSVLLVNVEISVIICFPLNTLELLHETSSLAYCCCQLFSQDLQEMYSGIHNWKMSFLEKSELTILTFFTLNTNWTPS